MKSEGGFVWACKNYDGDVQSDSVAQGKHYNHTLLKLEASNTGWGGAENNAGLLLMILD